jgi:hypothetical protein
MPGEVRLADMAEYLGLPPAVPDLPAQVEGTLVAGGRLGVVAEVMASTGRRTGTARLPGRIARGPLSPPRGAGTMCE